MKKGVLNSVISLVSLAVTAFGCFFFVNTSYDKASAAGGTTTYSISFENSSSTTAYASGSAIKDDLIGDSGIVSSVSIDSTSNKVYPGSGGTGGVYTVAFNNAMKIGRGGSGAANAGFITIALSTQIYSVRVNVAGYHASNQTTVTVGTTVLKMAGAAINEMVYAPGTYFTSFSISTIGPTEQRAIIYSIVCKYC